MQDMNSYNNTNESEVKRPLVTPPDFLKYGAQSFTTEVANSILGQSKEEVTTSIAPAPVETTSYSKQAPVSITDAPSPLQKYADEINVDIEILRDKWKLTYNEQGGISIPYLNENEEIVDVKLIDKDNKFGWKNGTEQLIYGEWRLSKYTDEYIVIVPDERNAHVLWANNIQAVALTKSNLNLDIGFMLEKFKEIYVFRDGSTFADELYNKIQNIIEKNKLYSIDTAIHKYKDFVELHIKGKLTLKTLEGQILKLVPNSSTGSPHVDLGNRVISELKLVFYDNKLFAYKNGVYYIVNDDDIISYILRVIMPGAKPSLNKLAIYYIRHILDDSNVTINHDVINYRNGLFDLNEKKFLAFTPNIFTINQLNVDYVEDEQSNPVVDKFLLDICNSDTIRVKALLQLIGYCLTTRNNIQKFVLFYGPKGSNGKSFTLKVIEAIIGKENVSHKGMELLAEGFEVKGIYGKQLNISFELPVTKIKDTSVLKATTTGDTIETKVKWNPDTLRITSNIKHIFATNYLPEVSDKTNGFYRRVHIIPFENQFDPSDTSFNEQDILALDSLNYLARRALNEYLEMLDTGKLIFANEEESKQYVAEFENQNDSVKAFVTFTLEPFKGDACKFDRKSFFDMYKDYCSENFVKPVGKHQFLTELRTKYGFYEKTLTGTL